jgi:hypothetical protein
MGIDHIRYDLRAQRALRGLLRDVLAETAKKGLPGEHHFYISFDTRADGVRLSQRLRSQYPEEMTIVLQHQFWDLKVTDDGFEVGLSFSGVPERLSVPFAAVKSFLDPSVPFALQFEQVAETTAASPAHAKPAQTTEKARENAAPLIDKPSGNAAADKNRTRKPAGSPPRTVPAIPPMAPLPAAPQDSVTGVKPTPDNAPKAKTTDTDDKPKKPGAGAEVVPLDRFRKK